MRKKDRIKGYLPVITGGLYLWVLNTIADTLAISLSDYKIISVGLWVILTVLSCIVLEQGIDLFDSSNNNQNEEE